MLENFNKACSEFFKKNLVVEDSNSDDFTYEFKKDEDGKLSCFFTIEVDQNKLIIVAKENEKNFMFTLIDKEGNVKNIPEPDFNEQYHEEYSQFQDALKKFKDEEKEKSESDENKSKIKSFKDALNKAKFENGTDEEITYDLDGIRFVFKHLKDELNQNYYECDFQKLNEEDEKIFYKALINLRRKNSLIMKILTYDEKGNLLEPVIPSELETKQPEFYNTLKQVIEKMQENLDDTL